MSQQEFWNGKFSRDGFLYGLKPNAYIASKIKSFPRGAKILCLGEGEGRNAIFLAKRGFEVTAIDASDIGLKKLEQRAQEENLNIKTVLMDLNEWESNEKYDVILATYLHMYKNEREELFEKIDDSLSVDGIFIGEFFSQDQLNYTNGGPKDLDLLYTTDDFRYFSLYENEIKQIETILDEGPGHQGEASVVRVFVEK